MARSLTPALAAAALLILAARGQAQVPNQAPPAASGADVSADCRVETPVLTPAPLETMRKALQADRIVKVLVISPSSATGIGASSSLAAYPSRLEKALEARFRGVDLDVVRRSPPREVAEDQIDRVKQEVADVLPDLVVWHVGSRDAMARVGLDEFTASLAAAVRWFAENRIDVVLVGPIYRERHEGDEHYLGMVKSIEAVAEAERVPLIRRFQVMRDLAKRESERTGETPDPVHLLELSYRCLVDYVTQAIVAGVQDGGSGTGR